jgi:hypothetical protein
VFDSFYITEKKKKRQKKTQKDQENKQNKQQENQKINKRKSNNMKQHFYMVDYPEIFIGDTSISHG